MAYISVKVLPSSSTSRIVGPYGDRIKIKVQAPPEGGKANRAVIDLISRDLAVPKSDVRIVSGGKTMDKVVEITGLPPERLKQWTSSQRYLKSVSA